MYPPLFKDHTASKVFSSNDDLETAINEVIYQSSSFFLLPLLIKPQTLKLHPQAKTLAVSPFPVTTL